MGKLMKILVNVILQMEQTGYFPLSFPLVPKRKKERKMNKKLLKPWVKADSAYIITNLITNISK